MVKEKERKRKMICENCKKQKAKGYFETRCNHFIPLCSRNCRDKFKRGIKREEDHLNEEYKAFNRRLKF